MIIVSVYDSKVEAFTLPVATVNEATAVRMFQSLVNDGQSDFSKFPEDYTLFRVGEWNEKEGKVIPAATPVSIVLAALLKAKE